MLVRALRETPIRSQADPEQGTIRAKLLKNQDWPVLEKVKGKVYQGNDQWFKDACGHFIWSGDLEAIDSANRVSSPALPPHTMEPPGVKLPRYKMDWPIAQLDVDRIWPYSMGEGVRIAILDSGLYEDHSEINPRFIVGRKNFLDGSPNVADTPGLGHGTLCAGLIAAQGKRLFGIAPGANLLIGKVVDSLTVKEDVLLKGIEWAITQGAHIISISLFRGRSTKAFRNAVEQKIKDSGVLLFASVGNNGDGGYEKDNSPACLNGVIGVGSYDRNGKLDPLTTRTAHLDFFAPGREVITLGLAPHAYCQVSGTSMATAIASGLAALLLSPALQQNPQLKPSEILPALTKNSNRTLSFADIGQDLASNSPKPVLNPLLAFQQTYPNHVT